MKIKRVGLLLAIPLVTILSSCVSSKQMLVEMDWDHNTPLPPKGTEVIVVSNSTFDCLIKAFLANDYKIVNENENRGYFLVEKAGDYDATIRHNIVLQENNDARITTEWKPGQSSQIMASAMTGLDVDTDWSKAVYIGGGDKPTYALLAGAKTAVNCGSIYYE